MKKKTLLLGVAALGLVATAASCDKKDDKDKYVTPDLEGKTMNVYINYTGQYGATFTGKVSKFESYTNPIDGQTYRKGDLLPMWKEVQTQLKCKINDAVWEVDEYVPVKDEDQHLKLKDYANFKNLDLVMLSNTSTNKLAADGKLLNLSKYMEYMPNYKAFLDANPAVKAEMTTADGEMFTLPYFDGINSPEHLFILNVELVEDLLDSENTNNFDTTPAKDTVYQPMIDTSKDFTVGISVNGKAKDLTVKKATNPVAAQNALTTKNGKTYADALRSYIDTAYMHDKTFTKRSEVFTSEHACYTTDDLIALMRVAVNNNALLKSKYGYEKNVEGFIPREGSNSRIDSVLWLMQIFGVQGIRGMAESDALYYDKAGNLCDGRTTAASYDGLAKLHQLYQEGLIISGFDAGDKTKYNSLYLTGKTGAALCMFDYNATQTVNNKVDDNGIGTKDSKFSKVMPVLPPLTKWENDNISPTKYAYTRYLESARANKKAGTIIPKHDNDADNIAACKLADYFYSKEGSLLQDYGPAAYRDGEIKIGQETFPKYRKKVITAVNESGLGWNNYCRMAMGTTQGIGHVRSNGVENQFTNAAGITGASNLSNAIASGVVNVALTSRKAGFGATVPAIWSSNPSTENTNKVQSLIDFWSRGVGGSEWREVVLKGWEGSSKTRASLEALFAQSAELYLSHYTALLKLQQAK